MREQAVARREDVSAGEVPREGRVAGGDRVEDPPVLAGPVEATAMGNLLVQARAHGWIPDSLSEIRSIVARSTQIIRYDPKITR